jgi:autotransporter translocation and assembly factor TamB
MRWRRLLAWIGGGLLGLVAVLFVALQTGPGQRAAASIASSDDLKISGLSGFFPTDLRVAEVKLVDRDGAWLTVDDARRRWASICGPWRSTTCMSARRSAASTRTGSSAARRCWPPTARKAV